MKRWKALVLASGLLVSMAAAMPAHAIVVFDQCTGDKTSKVCADQGNAGEQNATSLVKKIINTMLFALGIVAVIMIIWGSIKYVISRGSAENIKSAKDTVTYAIFGLVVALFAYAIVNFVLTSLK